MVGTTLGRGQEKATHLTPSCWTGLPWAERVWGTLSTPWPPLHPCQPLGSCHPCLGRDGSLCPELGINLLPQLCLQSCLRKQPPTQSLLPAKRTQPGCLATWFTQLRPMQAAAQGRVTARHGTGAGRDWQGGHGPCSPPPGCKGCQDPHAAASQTTLGVKVGTQGGDEGCVRGARWGPVCPLPTLPAPSPCPYPHPPCPALTPHAALLMPLIPGSG